MKRIITAFNFLTLNGYFKGLDEDISWHHHGEEGAKYSQKQLEANNILLFGRKTYEMMFSFWTSTFAFESFPVVAKRMNESEKILISDTLNEAKWKNTSLLEGNLISEIRKLKTTEGKDITILGSGTIINQLSEEGLIDKYEFLIDPVVIGRGISIFHNINKNLNLTLIESKVFADNGGILLTFKPS